MLQATITCDECGAVRGEVNRWWILKVMNCQGYAGVHLAALSDPKDGLGVHLCGETCVLKAVQKFLKGGEVG